MSERRDGHSKLVYDKATRTIIAVDPHPVIGQRPKPTIHELEAILDAPDGDYTVVVQPDGQIRAEPRVDPTLTALRALIHEIQALAESSTTNVPELIDEDIWKQALTLADISDAEQSA